MDESWKVYILRCGDGSLYTGITKDISARLEQHRSGKGAKYTRGRGPITVRYVERCFDKSQALKREYNVKRLSRSEKMELCAGMSPDLLRHLLDPEE